MMQIKNAGAGRRQRRGAPGLLRCLMQVKRRQDGVTGRA